MPARKGTIAATFALAAVAAAAFVAAAASCPPPNARDASACDAARRTGITTALCAADAQRTETCADHAAGVAYADALTRTASEWRKAALAAGPRTARARRWLAHAMVLGERVQDDPAAPAALRARAKRDEQLARTALLATR